MVKIRALRNGWLVTWTTFRIENYAAVEDGVAESAFTFDGPSERAACWSQLLEFVSQTFGMSVPAQVQ